MFYNYEKHKEENSLISKEHKEHEAKEFKKNIFFKTSKEFSFKNCSNLKFFDIINEDGREKIIINNVDPRNFKIMITIEGEMSKDGRVFPKKYFNNIRDFLSFYFSGTTLCTPTHPEVSKLFDKDFIKDSSTNALEKLRIMPYGICKEMLSLFIWEHLNPFVNFISKGRCIVSSVTIKDNIETLGIDFVRSCCFIQSKYYLTRLNKDIIIDYIDVIFSNVILNHSKINLSLLLPKAKIWSLSNPYKFLNKLNNN